MKMEELNNAYYFATKRKESPWNYALNIGYYFGQIREKYQGDYALFMEVSESESPKLKSISLDSDELLGYTGGKHYPVRSYVGVNANAELDLAKKLRQGDTISVFELDFQIVREEIVKKVRNIFEFEHDILISALAQDSCARYMRGYYPRFRKIEELLAKRDM
jgi:hypothetical protein